ncbi:MAG TPA: hypothetical protein PK950_03005 [Candidatus Paceibacterota bacterium]|nr:hypothetical protein [Candidatus Paceibacterota bacterium]
MFFIVGLLVIAFATILGFESYEWKHGLVKIVLMAILINFSNLIAQLVIDVAHIFTITFLNAVSATAGGNLITLFQMDKILALASGAPDALGQTRQVASLTLFAGSVLAFVFALLAALTIGAYLVVMVFRIVMLWALIVLSPLAFMLYAVPKGEDYAHEWWSEFSKHVIVAPIMVFFLWLAFATLGTGQIITEIQKDPNVIQLNSSGEAEQTVTVLEISTWENFASFLLAIGFLWVGIKKTEETGATGAGLVGNAIDFTKNVATIATGYAAGRWLVGGAIEGTKANIPIIGTKSLARKATMIKGAFNTAKTKSAMRRDVRVQDWEKEYKKARESGNTWGALKFGALRFGLGSLLASDKKKDAVAGTWEEMAHYADEEHEARISNSGTLGGSKKDEQRIRTEIAVGLKEAKGKQKEAEGHLKLMDDKQVHDDLNKTAETQTLSHKAEERLHAEEEAHHLHTEDEMRSEGEKELKKYFDEENKKRQKNGQAKMTLQERDAFARNNFRDFKGAAKYAALSRGLKGMQARNERYEEALQDEEKAKKEKEKLKQSRKNADFKSYDERATKAGLKYESTKGVYDTQAKKGSAEEFEKLMKVNSFKAEQEEQAILAARVKSMEDEKNAQKEMLLLGQIRDLLERGGFDQAIEAQVGVEIAKGRADTLREQRILTEKDAQGRTGKFDVLLEEGAELEARKEQVEIDKSRKLAEEKAKVYEGQGDIERAQAIRQQVEAQILKKAQELNQNLTFNQKRSAEDVALQGIVRLRNLQSQRPLTQKEQSELDQASLRQRARMLSNIADGGETSVATRAQAAKALGFDEVTPDNVQEIELRRALGIHKNQLGQNGRLYNVYDLQREFKQSLGAGYDMYMTRFIAAQKTAAGKGDLTGVAVATDRVKSDGSMQNDWTTESEQIDEGELGDALRKYFSADMSAEAGLLGFAEEKNIDSKGNAGVRKLGHKGNQIFKNVLRGKTARWFDQKQSFRITDQMNDIKLDIDADPLVRAAETERFNDFLDTINQVKSSLSEDAFDRSKQAWESFYKTMREFAIESNKLDDYDRAMVYPRNP